MRLPSSVCVCAWLALVAVAPPARGQTDPSEAAIDFFEKKVRPILVNHCSNCHSAETNAKGGLRVDDRNGLLTGGNGGPAVVPGEPARSQMLARVKHKDPKKRMPQEDRPLTEAEVADLTTWIREGAAWPPVHVPASLGKPKPAYEKLKKEHWAWQPLTDPKVPAVRDTAWPRDDVDRFLLAGLEAKQLAPVADADRLALLRRVTFDLIGLPPAPAAIDAFLADPSADAFAKVVDRLLGAPQFGERWGRHWLDVARYGESTGPSRNIPYPHAWKYRDYVIAAMNADIPFDRFLQEQIAGDLVSANSRSERDRLLTATGFLALGVKDVNQRFKVRFIMDNVDEQIDAITRSVLALTVSCARCHDHKFDPIPTTDYYALAGIFTSTDNCAGVRNKMGGGGLDYYDPSMLVALTTELPPVPRERLEKVKADLAQAKKEWDAIRDTPEGLAKGPDGQPKQRPFRLKYERLQADLLALTDPMARGHAVHAVREAKTVGDTQVRIRGEAEKIGPAVPRGFLTAFSVPGAAKVNPQQSGRLELAGWLTSPKNPLTPRVFVNRVWQQLFGRGIVSTVDNFGTTGDKPSHPELLDHLVGRFLRNGWSLKKLIRTIVLTRAYQLGSDAPPALRSLDPVNRLIWRHTPRRLDAEELRDAMLEAAGTLDRGQPAGSPAMTLPMIEMGDNGAEARNLRTQADRSPHRSVYLPLLRGLTPRTLEAFDPVEQTLVTGSRDTTTVPGQALYLLNSTFVRRQALVLGNRVLADAVAGDVDRVRAAYRLTLGRSPSAKEVERVQTFLAEYEAAAREMVNRPAGPLAEDLVRPRDARAAAWLAFVQSLFGSAEFRYLK
jgi:cytochrome c553